MTYDVFLPFLIIFSIFSIIIILVRKIPEISLEEEKKSDRIAEEENKKQRRMTVLFCKALSFSEKTLRQIRIRILKLDAKIFSLIQYLRKKSADKLDEINKLSHKTFSSSVPKKSDSAVEDKAGKKNEAEPDDKPPQKSRNFLARKIAPAIEKKANKISLKLQYKIEERKLIHIIAKNPKNAENYKKLGMLYHKNQNLADAEAAFGEYLKINPSDIQTREMLKKVISENQGKEK